MEKGQGRRGSSDLSDIDTVTLKNEVQEDTLGTEYERSSMYVFSYFKFSLKGKE